MVLHFVELSFFWCQHGVDLLRDTQKHQLVHTKDKFKFHTINSDMNELFVKYGMFDWGLPAMVEQDDGSSMWRLRGGSTRGSGLGRPPKAFLRIQRTDYCTGLEGQSRGTVGVQRVKGGVLKVLKQFTNGGSLSFFADTMLQANWTFGGSMQEKLEQACREGRCL